MEELKELALFKKMCYYGILLMVSGFVVVLIGSIVATIAKKFKEGEDDWNG